MEKEGQPMKGVRTIFVDYLKWIRGHNGKNSKRIQCSRRKVSQGSSILKETICAWEYLIQLPLPIFFWQSDVSSCWLWSTKDVKTLKKIFVWLVKKGESTSLYINKLIQWPGSLELATCQKGVININPPLYRDKLHWTLSYCSYLKAKTHWSWKKSLVQEERGKWLPFQGSIWKQLNLSSMTGWMWSWELCPYVSQATPNTWQPPFSFLFPFTYYASACQLKIILFNIVSNKEDCLLNWQTGSLPLVPPGEPIIA